MLTFSCKNGKQEKKVITQKEKIVNTTTKEYRKTVKPNERHADNITKITDCDEYWINILPGDTLKIKLINEILSEKKGLLSQNNLTFLLALISEKKTDFTFNDVLFPIFRLSEKEIGVFANSNSTKETRLVERFDTIYENAEKYIGNIRFYPQLLNFVFKGENRPEIYYFSINGTGKTKIKELGIYISDCLEYYEYSIDTSNISLNDKLFFGSKHDIDLVYENNPSIDTLINNSYKEHCHDCPNSMKKQRTFARIKGTDNLYFIYADTFPINNKLKTPSRALILVNKNNEIIYLWYDEIDLFGCSCL